MREPALQDEPNPDSSSCAARAGLTAHGFTSLQSAGWFGYYGYPASAQPWQNRVLWDWSRCCSSDVTRNRFFGLMGALFGYTVRSL